jgi:Lsr2
VSKGSVVAVTIAISYPGALACAVPELSSSSGPHAGFPHGIGVAVPAAWRLILYGEISDTKAGEAGVAQKVTVALEDDLDGGPADETLRFGISGAQYEIDLSASNAVAFRQQLAPFIAHARKAGRGPRRRPGRTASGREPGGGIRAWAKEHSIAVSERGRIPASVVEQYEAATTEVDRPGSTVAGGRWWARSGRGSRR